MGSHIKGLEPFLCRFMNAQQTAPAECVSVNISRQYQAIAFVEHCTLGCIY